MPARILRCIAHFELYQIYLLGNMAIVPLFADRSVADLERALGETTGKGC
jgi:hypothetical protein